MPTAGEFEAVADGLYALIGDLEVLAKPLENRMGAHVLEGGELTDSVYESLKTTRSTGLSLSAIVAEYRAEVVRRLEEARAAIRAQEDYEDDMDRYRRQKNMYDRYHDGDASRGDARRMDVDVDGDPPEPPDPPPPPADYIDL